ncbi:INO80 complex subunit E isoform X2 [Drosophila ficusphila]|uniref:INO80 complex subunit E isoform X2 n=1 Tax=Drosophila ficusphila TaxID=30025 RepID=UPI0007E7875F|nr:INO80 complex subunit E isoform X2 [Drosophila ficusphila]
MLEGWYCRSLANQEEGAIKDEPPSDDEPTQPASDRVPAISRGGIPASSSTVSAGLGANETDFKERYKNLKKKLKFLIYENEYFQDLLHTNQRRLLKVSRDRTFLLDRLLLYEKPAKDSSDSDATDSSDSEPASTSGAAGGSQTPKDVMRRKHKDKGAPGIQGVPPHMPTVGATRGRRRKVLTGMIPSNHGIQAAPAAKRQLTATVSPSQQQLQLQSAPKDVSPGLSQAEIARQLQERRPTPLELMSPECTSATVPTTMLSDESPSKCYPNESLQHLMEDDSHSHEVAAEECVPMEYTS